MTSCRTIWIHIVIIISTILLLGGDLFSYRNEITIICSGGIDGEIEPCGCGARKGGGLARRYSVIASIRSKARDAILVSVGNLCSGEHSIQTTFKGATSLLALNLMDYDAVGLARNDVKLIKELPITWHKRISSVISANVTKVREHSIPPVRMVGANGIKVGITAVTSLYRLYAGDEVEIKDIYAEMETVLNELSQNSDLVIVLSDLSYQDSLKIAKGFPTIDFMFIADGEVTDAVSCKVGDATVLRIPSGKDKLVQIQMVIDSNHVSFESMTLLLGSEVPKEPKLLKLHRQYLDKVKNFVVSRRYRADSEDSDYVGSTSCLSCHSEIYDSWKQTKHASAFNTLKLKRQAHNPGCIICHATEIGNEGLIPKRVNVQCEACHGPAKQHIDNPKVGFNSITDETCTRCHNREISPGFINQFTELKSKVHRKNK